MGTTVPLPVVGAKPSARVPGRLVVLFIVLAGALTGVGLIVVAFDSETVQQPAVSALLACWLTLPYVAAGVIAWVRRPESRMGPLMIAAGFVTSLNFLVWSPRPFLYTVGSAAQFLPPAMFLLVFLAFPGGRVESRAGRRLVIAGFSVSLLTMARIAFGEGGERNLVAISDAPQLVSALRSTELAVMSAVLLGGTMLLIGRRRQHRLRYPPGILIDSYSLGLAMIALLYLVQLFSWTAIAESVRLATFGVIGLTAILFLISLLQARLERAAVGDLVVALGVNPGPAELQEAVADTLKDRTVKIDYWLPEFEAYADVEGKQTDLELDPGRANTPITRDGEPVAMLIHDAALMHDPDLLSSVVAAIGMTIQNAQLQVELRARLEELRGSRSRIIEAEQRERRRLERDLHDGAQQRLVALSLELGELSSRAEDEDLRRRLEAARGEVSASLVELRDIAHGIHPASVSDHGLEVALESVATRSPLPVHLSVATHGRLPPSVELAAFYIVNEALTNVARHAEATAASVELRRESSVLTVEVADDGRGGALADGGTGLRGLADRVEALGGRIQVWSRPGEGTKLRAEIPCE